MQLRRVIQLIVISVLISAPLGIAARRQQNKPAKNRPTFSGTWVMDKTKSDASEYGFKLDIDITLVINHSDPQFKMIRTHVLDGFESQQKLQYFSDERGETNPTIIEGELIKSRTHWKGNRLITNSNGEAEWEPGVPIFYDRVDSWELSKDGQMLTHITRILNARSRGGQPLRTTDGHNVPPPFARSESRQVFRRSQ